MKKALILLVVLLFATTLQAQDKMVNDKFQIGFGAAIGKEILLISSSYPIIAVDFPSFYIPIIVSSMIKIEPHFGLGSMSYKNGGEETMTYMDFGAGVFFLKWYGPVNLSFGARFGMFNTNFKEANGVEEVSSRMDMYFGPALGGEYFFTKNFSLGGEIEFLYGMWGDMKVTVDGEEVDTGSDYDVTTMRTKTLFFIRWYL